MATTSYTARLLHSSTLHEWPCGLLQLRANIEELGVEVLAARLATATADRDEAAAAVDKCNAGVEAATRELAGAEAGDGRDESNRSMQERLADAQTAQARSLSQTGGGGYEILNVARAS
jgi:structural maintenance of chromosome 2